MDPIKDYVDNVVAEAIAAGKPKEEAEALRPAAEQEARQVAEHPLFKRFEGHARKRFDEHDTLKKEVAPLKTAAQKLREIEDANKSDVQKLTDKIAALEPGAARTAALEAQVQGIFDDATKDLTDAQKAAIVGDTPEAKLAHYRALVAAGFLEAKAPSRSPGGELPSKGGGNAMKADDFYALPLGGPFEAAEKRRKAGELTVIP